MTILLRAIRRDCFSPSFLVTFSSLVPRFPSCISHFAFTGCELSTKWVWWYTFPSRLLFLVSFTCSYKWKPGVGEQEKKKNSLLVSHWKPPNNYVKWGKVFLSPVTSLQSPLCPPEPPHAIPSMSLEALDFPPCGGQGWGSRPPQQRPWADGGCLAEWGHAMRSEGRDEQKEKKKQPSLLHKL